MKQVTGYLVEGKFFSDKVEADMYERNIALSKLCDTYDHEHDFLEDWVRSNITQLVALTSSTQHAEFEYSWDKAPSWVQFIATDMDGSVYGYRYRPTIDEYEWVVTGQVPCNKITYVMLDTVEEGDPDWEDSLQERPTQVKQYEYDWSKAPSWVNYIATDKDGEVYGFKHLPRVLQGDFWGHEDLSSDDCILLGNVEEASNWENSLVKRPTQVKKFEYDWDKAPDWVQFIATDSNGAVFGYNTRPEISVSNSVWSCGPYLGTFPHSTLLRHELNVSEPNWKDSLQERPSQVKEFKYDWSKVPSWAKYLVTDHDGKVLAFGQQPRISYFYSKDGSRAQRWGGYEMPIEVSIPPSPGYWKDSLRERPTQVKEFEYDWNKAPRWVKYIATDKDGSVYGFSRAPIKQLTCWGISSGNAHRISYSYGSNKYCKDWEKSLEERQ